MQKLLVTLMLCGLLSGACKKHPVVNNCIQQIIAADGMYAQTNYHSIDAYTYNGKTVYLLTSECCDFYNILLDENCNVLCAPSGGITGKGDGGCADFFAKASFVKQIWKKN